MATFDFPATPTLDQVYTPAGGATYKWNGSAWVTVTSSYSKAESDAKFVAKAGSTMTGTLNVPTVAIDANYQFYPGTLGPVTLLDANDYWVFDRAGNVLTWNVAGVVNATFTAAGGLTVKGAVTAPSHIVDANFQMKNLYAGGPAILFEPTTYLSCDQNYGDLQWVARNNPWLSIIGDTGEAWFRGTQVKSSKFTIDSTGWFQSGGASSAYLQYDTDDFWAYDRTNNNLSWHIGGAAKAIFGPTTALTLYGQDPLSIIPPGAGYGRVYYGNSARAWTAGVAPDGYFVVADETAGQFRFTLDTTGNAAFGGGNISCWGPSRQVTGWAMIDTSARIWQMYQQAANTTHVDIQIAGGGYGISMFASDITMKQDIVPSTTDILPIIRQIEFIDFKWKPMPGDVADYEKEIEEGNAAEPPPPSGLKVGGFSAQQLQTLKPDWINQGAFGTLIPDASLMLSNVFKALQEADALIQALTARVDALQAQLTPGVSK